MSDPVAAFAAIAERLLSEDGVTEGTGFGANAGLRVGGKIFAMLVRGELVVKLPAVRCVELVSSGIARPFERGQGRPLKAWITVGADAAARVAGPGDGGARVRTAVD